MRRGETGWVRSRKEAGERKNAVFQAKDSFQRDSTRDSVRHLIKRQGTPEIAIFRGSSFLHYISKDRQRPGETSREF